MIVLDDYFRPLYRTKYPRVRSSPLSPSPSPPSFPFPHLILLIAHYKQLKKSYYTYNYNYTGTQTTMSSPSGYPAAALYLSKASFKERT